MRPKAHAYTPQGPDDAPSPGRWRGRWGPWLWLGLPLLAALLLAIDQLRLALPPDDSRIGWLTSIEAAGAAIALVMVVVLCVRHVRAQAENRRHLSAMELLTRVSAAINARIAESPGVLDDLAEAARRLVGMKVGWVVVLEPDGESARILSIAGQPATAVGDLALLSEAPALRECVIQGRTIVVEDTERSTLSTLDTSRLQTYGTRSLLMAPLHTDGRIIGALAITDSVPRRIRPVDCRLAELWAAQAAVILQNQNMYQRLQEALRTQQRVQAQREALVNLSLSIYGGEAVETSLQRVADQAPSLLGVDVITLAQLVDRERGEWLIAAATETDVTQSLRGSSFTSIDSLADEALRRGEPIEVPDVVAEPLVHRELCTALRAKSLLFVPLRTRDGTPVAIMTLIQHRLMPFSAEQRQTAQYLATRCGEALEIARLHERAVADGQAKAILLRELHHRVKNNLAGIVGLLSINQPLLPAEARQWLDRVTERIRAMAQAHELFSGELDNLTLSQIVTLTLSSLSVVRPAGVRIETKVDGADAALRPDRAVALVMVLHELCHNAIVHGLGERGVLRIEGRMHPLRQLVLNVSDDGSSAADSIPHYSSGMGLGLVQGLVKRELRGQFALRPIPAGGTTAEVQFRLLDSEKLTPAFRSAVPPLPAAAHE